MPETKLHSKRDDNLGQVLSLPLSIVSIRALTVVLALAYSISVLGWVEPVSAQSPQGAYDEAEAQAIDRMLMCPVCPAESIDQAQVPLAKQMRQRVREMLAEGATRQEVLDYFSDRYGQNVLASPPKTGLYLLAWILPLVGVLAALAAGLFVLRTMTGRNDDSQETSTAPLAVDRDLEPYLAAVDQSLTIGDEDKPDNPSNESERLGSI